MSSVVNDEFFVSRRSSLVFQGAVERVPQCLVVLMPLFVVFYPADLVGRQLIEPHRDLVAGQVVVVLDQKAAVRRPMRWR